MKFFFNSEHFTLQKHIFLLLFFSFVLIQLEGQSTISSDLMTPKNIEKLEHRLNLAKSDEEKSDLLQAFAFSKIHSEPNLSIKYADLAIGHALTANYKKGIANGYHTKGLFYWYRGSYELTSDYFYDALQIREEIKDTIGMGRSYNNIGNLLFQQKNYNEALSFYEKSLDVRTSISDQVGILYCYNSLAEVYLKQGLNQKALNFYNKALQLAQDQSHSKGLALVNSNIGAFYLNQNDPQIAYQYFHKALTFSQKENHKNGIANNLNQLAKSLIVQKKDLPNAIQQAKLSVLYADSISALQLKANAYGSLSNAYALMEDYKTSLEYGQLQRKTELEVFDEARVKSVIELQTLHKVSEQQTEILKKENELLLKEKQLSNRSLLAILSLLLGFLISSFFIYKRWTFQKNTNKLLEQKNTELTNSNEALERFAFASSHDLREPLNNINSFTGLILKDAIKENNAKHINYATVIQNSCENLDSLIRGILDYSMLKSSNAIVSVDLNQTLQSVKDDLKSTIHNRNAIIKAESLPKINSDKTKIYQVFKNIIENGIKYNKSAQPLLEINCEDHGNKWRLKFKDNGIGIAKAHQEEIFQMFKRLHTKEEYQGSGIGLASIKTFIDNLSGQIVVNSDLGKGSEFVIDLPKI